MLPAWPLLFCALLGLGLGGAAAGQVSQSRAGNSGKEAEVRAVAYLVGEVPRWSRENHCYSCHNNGDAARALYVARRLSYEVPPRALADTTGWVIQPLEWDNNRGDPAFSDKKLARIQFAASLTEAAGAGLVEEPSAVELAADSLLPYQEENGSWQVDAGATIGSPATYGAYLATYMARRTLERADAVRFKEPIARADSWFRESQPKSTLDAAAAVLALHSRPDEAAREKVRELLGRLVRGQSSDGGWGPYAGSPPEPFDTAVVLLALARLDDKPETRRLIGEGRAYLLRTQLPSGGWPETTRPAGGQSYAQHISTSGWAALALLETRGTAPR